MLSPVLRLADAIRPIAVISLTLTVPAFAYATPTMSPRAIVSDTPVAAPELAKVIDPINGETNVDRTRPIRWTAVPGAQAYYLYIGTVPGAKDIVDSYETQETSFSIASVPVEMTLYVRLHTEIAGHWDFTDSTFIAEPQAAEFIYPPDGLTGVQSSRAFQWTSAIGAQAYRLLVGTTPGASDVLDSGTLTALSYPAAKLPGGRTLHARLWTMIGRDWARHTDIAFTVDTSVSRATMSFPFDAQRDVALNRAFEWQPVVLARGYRLTIGTTAGGHDLHDSGVIRVTQRFVPGLPVGVPLFGRLETQIGGQWQARDFTFTVADTTASPLLQIKAALRATDQVRSMAFADNRPSLTTELFGLVSPRYNALCTDYAVMLLQLLAEMNIQLSARELNLTFNGTLSDGHTLVELLDPTTNRWLLLDPTFDLTVANADGSFATFDDVSPATRTFDWTAPTYEFLGTAGDAYVRAYYLDYPLLYLNRPGAASLTSPVPYLQPIAMPATGGGPFFVIRCSGSAATQVVIDGVTRTVACDGADSTSGAFYAESVAAPAGRSFQLYALTRFVF